MKRLATLSILILLALSVLSSGCIETGKRSVQTGTPLAGYEITEHTYLWGPGGPFSKTYDIRVWVLGKDIFKATGISQAELNTAIQKYAASAAVSAATG
jgi:hypothetical protein